MKRTPALAVCVLLLAAAGCDDDTNDLDSPHTRVYVQDAATGLPVAGVKVVVMNPAQNRPLASPLPSDGDGLCDFGVTSGGAEVVAFGGGSWRVFGGPLLGAWKDLPAGDPGDPLAPKTPPAEPPFLVRMLAVPAPRGAHVSGRVIDADSGRPLGAAFVGLSPYPTGYSGVTTASDDVTLADGGFRVSNVRFVANGDAAPTQAEPLVVTRDGYLPRLWSYTASPGEAIDEITDVEIPLQRLAGGATGSLRGRLRRGTEPAPWITVGLCYGALPPDKGAVGLVGLTAFSDAEGEFLFTDVPVGAYLVYPGFRPRDGAWYPDSPDNVPHQVAADTETDAGAFQVVHEIEPWMPASGAVADRALRDFSWQPVPGAAVYVVSLDRGAPQQVNGVHWSLAVGDTLAPGAHVWQVTAYDAADRPIGTFGEHAEFLVRE